MNNFIVVFKGPLYEIVPDFISIGQKFIVIETNMSGHYYRLTNLDGTLYKNSTGWHESKRFKRLDEVRDEKLKELGIV